MIKKIKNNKMIFLACFLLLVFIQKCTTINITSNSLFKKKEYENYKYLKEGVRSDNFIIKKISESSYNSIFYDEIGDFFVIKGDEKIIKINNLGEEEFNISKSKKLSEDISFHSKGKVLTKYLEKYNRLILLKNTANNTYATRSSGGEQFLGTPDFVDVSKENKLIYPKYEGIKSHFYQKENTHGTIVYTNIPVSFMGTLYLSLKINNEVFKFKEKSVKNVGFIENPKYYVSHYVLPKIYADKNSISFLKVFYPSNAFNTDNEGVYIIKPKK